MGASHLQILERGSFYFPFLLFLLCVSLHGAFSVSSTAVPLKCLLSSFGFLFFGSLLILLFTFPPSC